MFKTSLHTSIANNPRLTTQLSCSFYPDFHGFIVCVFEHLHEIPIRVCSNTNESSVQPSETDHSNILQNHAPPWWRSVLRGPALGLHMRKPGCNGGTCYCNQRDLCNEKAPYFNVMEDGSCPGCHQDEEGDKENGGEIKSGNKIFLLTALVAALLVI